MFLPDQAARLTWISRSIRRTGLPEADILQPQRCASPRDPGTQQRVRTMALTVGFALLLLVLALVALATGAAANARAVVAPPPVFCEPATRALSAAETPLPPRRAPNRSWVMCVQPHRQDTSSWLVRCRVCLWERVVPLSLNYP